VFFFPSPSSSAECTFGLTVVPFVHCTATSYPLPHTFRAYVAFKAELRSTSEAFSQVDLFMIRNILGLVKKMLPRNILDRCVP
jgi:hypothetical protein